MIFVGTDIVPIYRIEKLIQEKSHRFLNLVFTEIEQNICNAKASPSIHYGGKFAAKEAVKKAIMSTKAIQLISLKTIEIQNDDDGSPIVKITKDGINYEKIKVSISHAGEYATATAILEL